MQMFVSVGLHACEMMEIANPKDQKMVIHFCRLYNPDKIRLILEKAQGYYWWRDKPIMAFMKAVGEINKEEKASVATSL